MEDSLIFMMYSGVQDLGSVNLRSDLIRLTSANYFVFNEIDFPFITSHVLF